MFVDPCSHEPFRYAKPTASRATGGSHDQHLTLSAHWHSGSTVNYKYGGHPNRVKACMGVGRVLSRLSSANQYLPLECFTVRFPF